MKMRHRGHLTVLTLLLAASGCGGSGLVEVTGKLTYKGEPVPSTLATFQPDDGTFSLRYSHQEAGAPRGRYTVFLSYSRSADEELGKIPSKASEEMKEVIAKYGGPKTSRLHYEVTKNRQFIPIDLE